MSEPEPDSQNETQRKTAQNLRDRAEETYETARVIMAAALAFEEGELTEQESNELVNLHRTGDEHAVIQSDLYPGDEYFDQATHELEGGL